MKKKPETKNGFTLIELLVVIGILAILAALLMPAINTMIKKGEQAQAQADAKLLASVWMKYFNEYGIWPVQNELDYAMNGEVVLMLRAYFKTSDPRNPKRIVFFEPDESALNSANDFVDPWGNVYKVRFDATRDGRIVPPGGGIDAVLAPVIAWSSGPDGQDATTNDNLTSW
ncbi:MAG TPA: hypothetical protein DCZ95_12710 [Verrucomicrobia bacterium]|nr:MAG: hypothetical protein A2X46_11955 [Lentisphaerae bacterium GWF2_57_35]HBA84948.1 hypothetical protein [Verrucomicrobiota bacterium]